MAATDEEAIREAARARLQERLARRGAVEPRSAGRPPSRETRSARTPSPGRASAPAATRQPGRSGGQRSAGRAPVPSRRFELPFSLPETLPVPPALIGGVVGAIVLLVLIFAVVVPSCSRHDEPEPSSPAEYHAGITARTGEAGKAALALAQAKEAESAEDALEFWLGEEEADKLIDQAKENTDALWIASHVDEYDIDGPEVQYKILKLAADEPAAIPYVRGFPENFPQDEASSNKELAMSTASPSDDIPSSRVPHLYQWDRRWAYTVYSSTSFGLTGCGPTSFAMAYQGATGNTDISPYDMGVIAQERGYMSQYEGTASTMFTEMAPELGFSCWEVYPSGENIRSELSAGHIVIANLGPGYFTQSGHYFVLTGIADNGEVIINDPYSVARSSQTWDADFIASESFAMFACA